MVGLPRINVLANLFNIKEQINFIYQLLLQFVPMNANHIADLEDRHTEGFTGITAFYSKQRHQGTAV